MKITSPDGLEIWARLAEKYRSDRAKEEVKAWRSVTELLKPPKVVALERIHEGEIEHDVLTLLRSIEGTALHNALAQVVTDNEFSGTRFTVDIDGITISGEPDYVRIDDDGLTLVDFKRVRAAIALYGIPEEYQWQVNIYAYMLRRNLMLPVKKALLHVRYSDWHQTDAKRDSRYPKAPLEIHEVELKSDEAIEDFLRERIRRHQEAEKDPQAVECSEEERWARGSYWTIVGKNGRALPKAKYETREEAQAAQEVRGGTVEFRPAVSKRCVPSGDYGGCPVRHWCKQFATIAARMAVEETEETA